LLLAGLAVAVREGLLNEKALQYAKDRFIDVNIFKSENKEIQQKLEQLPASCEASAEFLLKQKDIYLKHEVFDESIIQGVYKSLKSHQDKDLSERLYGKNEEIRKLVQQYIHC
jgi:glutamine synthetase